MAIVKQPSVNLDTPLPRLADHPAMQRFNKEREAARAGVARTLEQVQTIEAKLGDPAARRPGSTRLTPQQVRDLKHELATLREQEQRDRDICRAVEQTEDGAMRRALADIEPLVRQRAAALVLAMREPVRQVADLNAQLASIWSEYSGAINLAAPGPLPAPTLAAWLESARHAMKH